MKLDSLLELFVGLSLTFGCVSLMVSGITEALAAISQWRSRTLLSGVKQLLNDPDLSGLAEQVLQHAAVNPLLMPKPPVASQAQPPQGKSPAVTVSTMPSYIDPRGFASALIDTIQQGSTAGAQGALDLRAAINKMTDAQLRLYLLGLYDRTGNDVTAFHDQVANWFDAAMDRLSGTYKRVALLVSFIVDFALAAVLNIDAIHLAQTLWATPQLSLAATKAIDPAAVNYQAALQQWSKTFPVGWELPLRWPSQIHISIAIGWLITALATLFGAPFWFDILQRFVQVRATGPAPGEK